MSGRSPRVASQCAKKTARLGQQLATVQRARRPPTRGRRWVKESCRVAGLGISRVTMRSLTRWGSGSVGDGSARGEPRVIASLGHTRTPLRRSRAAAHPHAALVECPSAARPHDECSATSAAECPRERENEIDSQRADDDCVRVSAKPTRNPCHRLMSSVRRSCWNKKPHSRDAYDDAPRAEAGRTLTRLATRAASPNTTARLYSHSQAGCSSTSAVGDVSCGRRSNPATSAQTRLRTRSVPRSPAPGTPT